MGFKVFETLSYAELRGVFKFFGLLVYKFMGLPQITQITQIG